MSEFQENLFELKIRLACLSCEREDYDGIESIKRAEDEGWTEILEDDTDHGDLVWWTHIGACPHPDCKAEYEGD